MLFFQILLWALLLVPFAGVLLGQAAVGIAYVVILTGLAQRVFSFDKKQFVVAVLFSLTYALVSALLFLSLFYNFPAFVSVGLAVAAWLGLFLFLRYYHGFMNATVLGYDNGYAIVRVEPSLVSWVPAGVVYAVASKRVKKGVRVRVRFDWLTRKGEVE